MVEEIVGSKKLRKAMPFGAIKEIAKTFDRTDAWIAQVIAGNRVGDVKIVECAKEVAAEGKKFKNTLSQILKKYEQSN